MLKCKGRRRFDGRGDVGTPFCLIFGPLHIASHLRPPRHPHPLFLPFGILLPIAVSGYNLHLFADHRSNPITSQCPRRPLVLADVSAFPLPVVLELHLLGHRALGGIRGVRNPEAERFRGILACKERICPGSGDEYSGLKEAVGLISSGGALAGCGDALMEKADGVKSPFHERSGFDRCVICRGEEVQALVQRGRHRRKRKRSRRL